MKRLIAKSMFFVGLLWLCGLSAQAQLAVNPSVPSRIEVHVL